MSEDAKMKSVELSDEEAANAAGGMAPEGYSPCAVRYDCSSGGSFCASACKYRGTNDCMMSYCKITVCDEVMAAYKKWIESH